MYHADPDGNQLEFQVDCFASAAESNDYIRGPSFSMNPVGVEFDPEEDSMVAGECNCGAVQFEIDADLSGVYVCHCSICRRSTGSNGIAVVVVPDEQFRWVRGQEHIATWKKPDTDWQTWFCSVCGSPVPGENDATRKFVPAGSITRGGDALKVIHHIWVGSKAVWDEIGDSGQQHTGAFSG